MNDKTTTIFYNIIEDIENTLFYADLTNEEEIQLFKELSKLFRDWSKNED